MMGIHLFGPRLPKAVQHDLGILSGERVMAWGCGPEADVTQVTYAAATDRALYVQSTAERIPWDHISKAHWDEPMLEVVVLDEAGQPLRLVRVRLDDAKDLPAAVHDRVTASVLISERVEFEGGGGALMVARRGSDDDVIRWSVVFDAGLDTGDARLRGSAAEALGRLRDSLGI